MTEILAHIAVLQDECIQLCADLRECLNIERGCLIQLQTDGVLQNNLRKETLAREIAIRHRRLDYLIRSTGVESAEALALQLPEDSRAAWIEKRRAWLFEWSKTRELCESNQKFLKHSLKNLGLLVDNLKRCLGENSLYSAQGRRVDMNKPGKVVEAKY